MRAVAAVAALLAALALPAHARGPGAGPTQWDACFAQAGAWYGVNPLLLKAIARQESSMTPSAVGRNTNGTVDLGLMQINSTHLRKLARFGITRERLMDACTNITVGAWLLADAVSRHGMTWRAVGAYHSPTPWRQTNYAAKVARHLMLEIQAAGGVTAAPSAAPVAPVAAEVAATTPAAQAVPGSVVWEAKAGRAAGGAP